MSRLDQHQDASSSLKSRLKGLDCRSVVQPIRLSIVGFNSEDSPNVLTGGTLLQLET